jgi:hypothetical protein
MVPEGSCRSFETSRRAYISNTVSTPAHWLCLSGRELHYIQGYKAEQPPLNITPTTEQLGLRLTSLLSSKITRGA